MRTGINSSRGGGGGGGGGVGGAAGSCQVEREDERSGTYRSVVQKRQLDDHFMAHGQVQFGLLNGVFPATKTATGLSGSA